MAPIDFATNVYAKCQDTFGGPVLITPVKSQPGQPAYSARGIYGTEAIDIIAEDGSIISDQRTILDILETEYKVLPVHGDYVFLAKGNFANQLKEDTTFEIIDDDSNGGGETTLTLRKIVEPRP
jgi:hypothetical protein